jgi:nuclease YhcG-like protein
LDDDFAFLGRRRRLRIDDTWFRLDLVFFHRRLRCLVIIDLKVDKFSYPDVGQMHVYLNAGEHWMKPRENPPVGLILRRKGSSRGPPRIRQFPQKVLAAEYQTVLPDEKLIAQELERSRPELEKRAALRMFSSNRRSLTADQSAAEHFRVAVARPGNRQEDRIQFPNEQSSNLEILTLFKSPRSLRIEHILGG